jgi:hypothetical protein
MVDIQIADKTLKIEVLGWDKFWAFKSRLSIPLEHVVSARLDGSILRKWLWAFKAPGSALPGIIIAGTFYSRGRRMFWDVHNPKEALVIELKDEKYTQLVLEVQNPELAVKEIGEAIGSA